YLLFTILTCSLFLTLFLFFFHPPPTSNIYTLSLHDALPIYLSICISTYVIYFIAGIWHGAGFRYIAFGIWNGTIISMSIILEDRSEEHTSELQSRFDLVCRLLLEKKNKKTK